jgi:hypothetical protein
MVDVINDSVNAEEMNTIASMYYGFDMMAICFPTKVRCSPRTRRAVLGAARRGLKFKKGLFYSFDFNVLQTRVLKSLLNYQDMCLIFSATPSPHTSHLTTTFPSAVEEPAQRP